MTNPEPLPPHRHHYHQSLDGEARYMGHWHDDEPCRDPRCPDLPEERVTLR